jgi:hypothetical protein
MRNENDCEIFGREMIVHVGAKLDEQAIVSQFYQPVGRPETRKNEPAHQQQAK